jgi:hypothetical protein
MPKQMGEFLSMGLGDAFVESLLQLFLRLMIEFLVPALGLTGLLPKLIRAADNINLSGLAHWLLSRRLCRTPSAELGTRKDVTVEAHNLYLNDLQETNSSRASDLVRRSSCARLAHFFITVPLDDFGFAVALNMDPIELRRINDTTREPIIVIAIAVAGLLFGRMLLPARSLPRQRTC